MTATRPASINALVISEIAIEAARTGFNSTRIGSVNTLIAVAATPTAVETSDKPSDSTFSAPAPAFPATPKASNPPTTSRIGGGSMASHVPMTLMAPIHPRKTNQTFATDSERDSNGLTIDHAAFASPTKPITRSLTGNSTALTTIVSALNAATATDHTALTGTISIAKAVVSRSVTIITAWILWAMCMIAPDICRKTDPAPVAAVLTSLASPATVFRTFVRLLDARDAVSAENAIDVIPDSTACAAVETLSNASAVPSAALATEYSFAELLPRFLKSTSLMLAASRLAAGSTESIEVFTAARETTAIRSPPSDFSRSMSSLNSRSSRLPPAMFYLDIRSRIRCMISSASFSGGASLNFSMYFCGV